MKILFLRLLEGANIYSYSPVLFLRVAIGKFEHIPINMIPGFVDRLIEFLPGLGKHYCSPGYPGGFLERLREGTYLVHIFEHVLLELQHIAGYDMKFGRTRRFSAEGIYNVVVGIKYGQVAIKAAQISESLLNAIIGEEDFDLAAAIAELEKISKDCELGPSTAAVYEAAKSRKIPITRIGNENMLILGYGCKQRRIWTTITDKTSCLASDLACDKEITKKMLYIGGLPVPFGIVISAETELPEALNKVGFPVAINPVNANHGKGVTLNISNFAEAVKTFAVAKSFDNSVLVEEFIGRRQYRLCVIGYKLAAAAERVPPLVIGDGRHTVKELVEIANQDARRGDGHEKPLTIIKIDEAALITLRRQKLDIDSVPEFEKEVFIRDNANIKLGWYGY